jgi:hypothetical protein
MALTLVSVATDPQTCPETILAPIRHRVLPDPMCLTVVQLKSIRVGWSNITIASHNQPTGSGERDTGGEAARSIA